MIVRTWNLFHGNTSPPGRRAYLREMVELVTADRPGIVCLQEVPAWALDEVGTWAGMRAVGDRTRRPRLPVLGRRITSLHAGLFRSGLHGQGNVILLQPDVTVRERKVITLNTNVFCEEQGRRLGLDEKLTRWWEAERRICHTVKIELPNRTRMLVANLHATSYDRDPRLPDAELRRATSFVTRQSDLKEVLVIAGDFNVTRERSQTIHDLTHVHPEDTWAGTSASVDHVLVRGAAVTSARVWPDDERRLGGKLLSDHAPVEVEIRV
jgi:endonuclease/exonuclease/phosphatase family metal-dependent hydrolase